MVVVVRQVREVSPPRANAPRRRQRFIQAHVRGMRLSPERVEHGHLYPVDLFYGLRRHLLAVAHVSQSLLALLDEEIPPGLRCSVWQPQGHDV